MSAISQALATISIAPQPIELGTEKASHVATTSVRSPSLLPPNGLANTTSCDGRPGLNGPLPGLYCGCYYEISSCENGRSCETSAFALGMNNLRCEDYGFLRRCAQAKQRLLEFGDASLYKSNCPMFLGQPAVVYRDAC